MFSKNLLLIIIVLLFIPIHFFAQTTGKDSIGVDTAKYYYDEEYDMNYDYEEDNDYEEYEPDFKHLGEINFIMSFPVSNQKKKLNHNTFGFDLGYSRQLVPKKPLYGSLGFSYSFYGSESYEYYLATPVDGYGDEWRESFLTNFLSINAGAKYFLNRSIYIFNPYFQIDLKYRYLFGYISTTNIEYGEATDFETKGGNGSFGYDISAGTLIDINSDRAFLHFSIGFDGGGGMKYFNKKENPDEVFYVTDYFDQLYLPTSFLTFKLGIIFF